MQLHRHQIPALSQQIVKALVDAEDIEVESRREVERDVESVLSSYAAQVDQVLARAREMSQARGLPQGQFGKIKQLAAEQAGIKIGDEGLDFLLAQLIEMLMYSSNVQEVFAEDHELRRRIRPFLKAGEEEEARIEAEVRGKLKHVEEGSRVWEIEYERMKAEIKRRRGT